MKRKLIYNLGRRGFFSEINNMILAKIFADHNKYQFEVNSFYWNCKYKKGLRDYFKLSIEERNNVFSAQQSRSNRKFVFCPKNKYDFFYNTTYILNYLYRIFNNKIILGNEIYEYIRSDDFLQSVCESEYMNEVKKLMTFSSDVNDYIEKKQLQFKLPKNYLGVHIRRGDKITTGEMNNISIDEYILSIRNSGLQNVYIATDDASIAEEIRNKCINFGIYVFFNNTEKKGFREGDFNHSTVQSRYEDTMNLLLDIYILSKAQKFIGTYSSNLSRVIPCLIGVNKCISLDNPWHVG